jgi:enamine deaminase RidA (YjgF/YER057c/UK114 family)
MEWGNPKELFNSVQYGFSQAVAARGTRIVSISGQVAWNEKEEMVGGGDLYLETMKALENLQIALRSVRAELSDVIALRLYIVDYKREESEGISRALKAFFPGGEAPTATWIGVSCLANPDFRIEIEATAVVAD